MVYLLLLSICSSNVGKICMCNEQPEKRRFTCDDCSFKKTDIFRFCGLSFEGDFSVLKFSFDISCLQEDDDIINSWNMRKCSAAGLDILSTVFKDEILPVLMPLVQVCAFLLCSLISNRKLKLC